MNVYHLDPHGFVTASRSFAAHACLVARVLGYLAGGMSFDDVQKDFGLAPADVRAALGYAAELLNQEQHHPLPV